MKEIFQFKIYFFTVKQKKRKIIVYKLDNYTNYKKKTVTIFFNLVYSVEMVEFVVNLTGILNLKSWN